MQVFVLLIALCATNDPAVEDCEIVFSRPVHAETEAMCLAGSQPFIGLFRPVRAMPFLAVRCVAKGEPA